MAQDKDLKTPNVPPLRFPGFTDEWKECTIRDIAKIEKGNGISKDQLSEEGDECILYGELYTKYKSEIIDEVYSKTKVDSTKLMRSQANDVLIPCSGETAEDIATARCVKMEGILLGGDLNIMRFDKQDGAFMSYQLNGKRKYDIARVAQGVSVVHLYPEHLKSIKVVLPELEEQQKIVNLLSLIDERIATQNKIIEDLKKLKSAIIDRLYSEVKGETCTYSELFTVVTERNSKRTYNKVIAASQEYGMVERESLNLKVQFDEELINTYKIINSGDYVIHLRSFQGGFAFSKLQGICSPAYIILRPNDRVEFSYFENYFTSSKFINSLRLVTYGIRDGRSINVEEWLSMKVTLPSKEEQKRIIRTIQSIQDKVSNEIRILTSLHSQRLFLLRELFI